MQITNFHIKNFKKFEDFELNNIGHFNLIVGDNNVGKTTLLEALLWQENFDQSISSLIDTYAWRGIDEITQEDFKRFTIYDKTNRNGVIDLSWKNNKKQHDFILYLKKMNELDKIESKKLNINYQSNTYFLCVYQEVNKKKKIINVFALESNIYGNEQYSYMPIIPINLGYKTDITDFYSQAIQSDNNIKKEFIESIRLFIPLIEDIEITLRNNHPSLSIRQKNSPHLFPLPLFGEGSVKVFRILLEIFIAKLKGFPRIMIDEIDTGLYYSRMKNFWKIIIRAAENNDIQLFATTHNWECMRYFKEVLEDNDMKILQPLARCFSLKQLPNNYIKAFSYEYPEFEQVINENIEIR